MADVDSILTTPIDTSIVPWTAQEAMVIDWERQWTEWCATAHCVSSDTSLWNVEDVSADDVESSLDSASIAEGLAALHVLSELDALEPNCAPPHCHLRQNEKAAPRDHVGSGHVFPLLRRCSRDCAMS